MIVANIVKRMISDQLHCALSDVTDDACLAGDLNADSLDVVELVMDFETTFDIEIHDDEIVGLGSVQSLVNLVEKKVGAK